MRLLINTATVFKGGSVQVAYSFLEECKKKTQHQFIVVLGKPLQELISPKDFPSNFTFETVSDRPAQAVLSFKDQAKPLKEIEKKYCPDVVFTTSGPAYWRPKAKHLMGYNLGHYIYKDSPFFKNMSMKEKLYWMVKGKLIKYYTVNDANAYVVQTDDVKRRLKKWIGGKKIYTVTNTFGVQFEEPVLGNKLLPNYKHNELRLLVLSSYYKHKQLEIINNIVDYFDEGESIKFVVTLPDEVFQYLFTQKAKDYIHNVGVIPPKDCPQLYSECQAVFLPTLLECFSATYVEAMKMKLPIITTNLSFAHSVCGQAALYFDSENPQDAYYKIKQLQTNSDLHNSLLEKAKIEIRKFNSAEERANKYIEICEALGKNEP